MCRESKEYQGHGWGMAWRQNGLWQTYKSLTPIWEDRLPDAGEADLLAVHARSAFRDEGILLENNMPFSADGRVFIFNGELHGVRLKARGRIGAEKIFTTINRMDRGDPALSFQRAVAVITKRARKVRAMNILMTDGRFVFVNCQYAEDPDYFRLYHQTGEIEAFCSQPLGKGWRPLPNHSNMVV